MPLTTYTFSTGAADANETVSATDDERLPSGGFSLRNGFPHWFGRSRRRQNSRNDPTRASDNSRSDFSHGSRSPSTEQSPAGQPSSQVAPKGVSVVDIVAYLKSSFEDTSILDELPIEAAANSGAWHAWRSYRGLPKAVSRVASPAPEEAKSLPVTQKLPGDWNWEGVWEKRVRSGIEASLTGQVLFGGGRGASAGNDLVSWPPTGSGKELL